MIRFLDPLKKRLERAAKGNLAARLLNDLNGTKVQNIDGVFTYDDGEIVADGHIYYADGSVDGYHSGSPLLFLKRCQQWGMLPQHITELDEHTFGWSIQNHDDLYYIVTDIKDYDFSIYPGLTEVTNEYYRAMYNQFYSQHVKHCRVLEVLGNERVRARVVIFDGVDLWINGVKKATVSCIDTVDYRNTYHKIFAIQAARLAGVNLVRINGHWSYTENHPDPEQDAYIRKFIDGQRDHHIAIMIPIEMDAEYTLGIPYQSFFDQICVDHQGKLYMTARASDGYTWLGGVNTENRVVVFNTVCHKCGKTINVDDTKCPACDSDTAIRTTALGTVMDTKLVDLPGVGLTPEIYIENGELRPVIKAIRLLKGVTYQS